MDKNNLPSYDTISEAIAIIQCKGSMWGNYVRLPMVYIFFGVLCKDRTPGSDSVKGGLSTGNVVEVDLEKNSQSAQPILTS